MPKPVSLHATLQATALILLGCGSVRTEPIDAWVDGQVSALSHVIVADARQSVLDAEPTPASDLEAEFE